MVFELLHVQFYVNFEKPLQDGRLFKLDTSIRQQLYKTNTSIGGTLLLVSWDVGENHMPKKVCKVDVH